ncbi:MAG TPA: GntR family transcriptional regulator [Puia sp.]|jgi:DNA-binding transcriptional regulator YhcF (GntR family)|nr:GntR family transcriptional regulator [Puia sp.]
MTLENIFRLITIDAQSVTPKYLQVVNSILNAIKEEKLGKGYVLPSINDLSYELEISRDTGERAYRHLKNMGVIGSVPGKGYFISNSEFKQPLKIFLLFNKLSTHKKIIYDAFAAALGQEAAIDFYIYNNDYSLFKKLLINKQEDYSYYVIIPHFLEGGEKAHEIINTIPKEKLLIMSKLIPGVDGAYAAIFEDFERDIYSALTKAIDKLKKYRSIKIIFPEYTYHPREILDGFYHFCQDYAFDYEVISAPENLDITEGTAYISLMEDDLVTLIKKILERNFSVGKQVGVISYNETPMKQIILNGITTISTDFTMMGKKAAELILSKSKQHIAVPFYLTLRDSL